MRNSRTWHIQFTGWLSRIAAKNETLYELYRQGEFAKHSNERYKRRAKFYKTLIKQTKEQGL